MTETKRKDWTFIWLALCAMVGVLGMFAYGIFLAVGAVLGRIKG